MKEQKLIYVNIIGKNSEDEYMYEFYFTDDPEVAWGTDWDIKPAVICNLGVPQKQTYDMIKTFKSEFVLSVAQKNSCFSMLDCKDGIIPVAWENIDGYEEYPENGRLIFPFGISLTEVENKLSIRDICFDGNNNEISF